MITTGFARPFVRSAGGSARAARASRPTSRSRTGPVGVVLQLSHQHALGDHVPARPRARRGRFRSQRSCVASGHGRRGVEAGVAGRLLAVAAGVVGSVLARVEQVELGDVAVAQPPVELDVASPRPRAQRHRHVLEVGLVADRPPRDELRARVRPLGVDARVVVVDLVVVPGDHPGEQPVRLLEVRVGLVERVLEPVALEREALGRERGRHGRRCERRPSRRRTRRCSRRGGSRARCPPRPCAGRASRTRRPTSGRTRTRSVRRARGRADPGAVFVRPTGLASRSVRKR